MESRSVNIRRNMISGLCNKILLILLPFAVRSILIYKLGSEYLGLNSLFASILQVLNLTEMGFSNAVIYALYKPIAQGDKDKICAYLRYYRRIYKYVGSAIFAAGMLLLPFLRHLIKGSYPPELNLQALFLIYLFNTVLSYWAFAYKNVILTAHQRNDINLNLNNLSKILMYVTQLLLLSVYQDYYYYVLAMPVFTLLYNILCAIAVKRKYPEFICKGRLKGPEVTELKKNVYGIFINRICQTMRSSLDSIIISVYWGLVLTAVYNNYFYIITAITGVMAVIVTAFDASVGNSVVAEGVEKNYQDFKNLNFLYMWLSGWFTACFLCLLQPFMKLWVGSGLMLPFSSVVLFCLYFYLLTVSDIYSVYYRATGLWWHGRYRGLAEAFLNGLLNLILGKLWGINGVIIATMVSLLLLNIGYSSTFLFRYYFKEKKVSDYFKQQAFYGVHSLLICSVTFWACSFLPWEGVPELLSKAGVCLILPNLLFYGMYRKKTCWREAKPYIQKFIKNGR